MSDLPICPRDNCTPYEIMRTYIYDEQSMEYCWYVMFATRCGIIIGRFTDE